MAWAVMHEVPASCVPASCAENAREIRIPRAWGGGDEPLYEWCTVLAVSVCDAGAYRYVVIERRGEGLRGFDYASGKEVAGDVEDFEPRVAKCFKVASARAMGAEELARLLLSYAEEVGWKPRSSPLPFKGIFAEFFLDTVAFHFHGVNLFEVELEGGKVKVNGREFRVRAAEEYVEELEAARQLARSWQATMRELAEELDRDPRGAERRLQRLLEDLAGARGGQDG
jgi:hypothetical protein